MAMVAVIALVAPAGISATGGTPVDRLGSSSIRRWMTAPAARVAREARAAVAAPYGLIGAGETPAIHPVALPGLARLPKDLAAGIELLAGAGRQAGALEARAFATLTPRETARLFRDARSGALLRSARTDAAGHPSTPADAGIASKVDSHALASAARVLAQGATLATPFLQAYVAELRGGAAALDGGCDRPGPIFCDPQGVIEVWGTEDDVYTTDSVAKIRVDLGGNDVYDDHTATVPGPGCPIFDVPTPDCLHYSYAANIDLSGNDTYLADNPTNSEDVRQGAAEGGVAVLVDASGDDTYSALNGQGFGIVGAGVLLDGQGNDTYTATNFAQGFGFLEGVGLLADGKGSDRYETQGGEGVGWFGAGALVDGAGNDTYRGEIFAQGTGVIGAGLLLDASGNDSYSGADAGASFIQGSVIAGGAGALVDLAGKDAYSSGSCALGCALYGGTIVGLVNAIVGTKRVSTDAYALFVDASGMDRYVGASTQTFGFADVLSMARFRDLGHADDVYSGANHNPSNNHAWRQGGFFVRLFGVKTGIPSGEGEDR